MGYFKYYIVYKTTNNITGKFYIGQHRTSNLEDGYLGSGKRLRRAIKYYGKENFTREILFSFDNEDDMYQKEAELVNEEFIKRDDVYNLTLGGKPNWFNHKNFDIKEISKKGRINANKALNAKFKEEGEYRNNIINKISNTLKTKFKNGLNPGFKDKKHSEHTKQKIREKASERTGDKNSQFGTCWITNDIENRKIKKDEQIPDGWKLGRKIK